MEELIEVAREWRLLLAVPFVVAFSPTLLRIALLAYPRGDPRRREIPARLYESPEIKDLLFVARQTERALFEGLGERWRRRSMRFARSKRWATAVGGTVMFLYLVPTPFMAQVGPLVGIVLAYGSIAFGSWMFLRIFGDDVQSLVTDIRSSWSALGKHAPHSDKTSDRTDHAPGNL